MAGTLGHTGLAQGGHKPRDSVLWLLTTLRADWEAWAIAQALSVLPGTTKGTRQ